MGTKTRAKTGKKGGVPAAQRPLAWLEEASAVEIGEALFAVGITKAGAVAHYLATRLAKETGRSATEVVNQFERDPVGSLGRFIAGGAQRMMGD